MKIRNIVPLLLLCFASTAHASDDKITLASFDPKRSVPERTKYSPPRVIDTTEYYEIRGTGEQELLNEMARRGSTWDDGRKYDSVTSWSWTWDLGSLQDEQACSAEAFQVTVTVRQRLPIWVRTDDAPEPLVEKWEDYMKSLMIHEYGHRDMAVDTAAEFSRAVADLPRDLGCNELDQRIRILSRMMMARLNAEQRKYDEATKHGITQGALFP